MSLTPNPAAAWRPAPTGNATSEPATGPGKVWTALVSAGLWPTTPLTLFSRKFSSLPSLFGVTLSQSLTHCYNARSRASP